MLRQGVGSLPIPDLAQKFGVSQRQLERLYHSQVGMSPKQYSRLVRVETARLLLRQMDSQTGSPSTTTLAADLGFYDQSHFIREFTQVVGITPYRYMQRRQKRKQSESETVS